MIRGELDHVVSTIRQCDHDFHENIDKAPLPSLARFQHLARSSGITPASLGNNSDTDTTNHLGHKTLRRLSQVIKGDYKSDPSSSTMTAPSNIADRRSPVSHSGRERQRESRPQQQQQQQQQEQQYQQYQQQQQQQARQLPSQRTPDFMPQSNGTPPAPIATQGPNSVPPPIRSGYVPLSNRPDINASRNISPVERTNRPEMKGPTDISNLLSGLKVKKTAVNIQNDREESGSTISISELKEMQNDNTPLKSKRRKSERNTVSLDI
jgi:type II secretory pathway pseudopilin PulG